MDQQVVELLGAIAEKLDGIYEILLDFDTAYLEDCEEDEGEEEDPAEDDEEFPSENILVS